MRQRSRQPLTPSVFLTVCIACSYPIPPIELLRNDGERVRCPKCQTDFIPETKGNWSHFGS
jgi:hypothetical protein